MSASEKRSGMDNSCEVLIVGAGPSGLSAALFLASRGRKITVIDKNLERSDKTRAIGVQAGTLELYRSAFGAVLSDEMVACGVPARELTIHVDQAVHNVKFNGVPSDFDFILILNQAETERMLEERLNALGVQVLRGHELVDLQQNSSGVSAVVRRIATMAQEFNIRAQYAIGSDGAHSATRKMLGLEFSGGMYDGKFVLADLRVRWDWSYQGVHAFLSAQGAALFFPLKIGNREHLYRLILIPREGTAPHEGELDLERLRAEASPYLPEGIELSDPLWLSRFNVHHRMAPAMGVGRVFLCGDAAHIHSPIGAQGMNTGIHDALDLGWRLNERLLGKAGDKVFDGFLRERHRNASQVVKFTDLAFRMALARESQLTAAARKYVLPTLLKQSWLRKPLLRTISQVRIAARMKPHLAAQPQRSFH